MTIKPNFLLCAMIAAAMAVSAVTVLAQGTVSKPVRVGGNVMSANLINKVNPVYPPDAKARRAQGKVLLDIMIDKEGKTYDVTPQSTGVDSLLVSAAIEAVQQWVYKPTLLNGEPVEVKTTVEVNFTLTD